MNDNLYFSRDIEKNYEGLDENFKSAFNYFKFLHKDQYYPNGKPYWTHLLRVGNVLDTILKFTNEKNDNYKDIVIAGFGHDSLEDTNVTFDELKDKFGERVSTYIFGMTNEEGDLHTQIYINKIINNIEEVKLIKLADIFDNYTGILNDINEENVEFFKNKIMPIIEPMFISITKVDFKLYTQSGNILKDKIIILNKLIKEKF